VDGNGRTSRLLSTLLLYRSGYDFRRLFTLSEFYDRDRSRFYRALQNVRERDMDLTGWLEFFVEGLSTQLGEVVTSGKRVMRRDAIAREHALNERQARIVGLLLEGAEARLDGLEGLFPGVNRRSVQRDLQGLVEKGVAKSVGAARATRYRLDVKGL
jgi:Fic family protein